MISFVLPSSISFTFVASKNGDRTPLPEIYKLKLKLISTVQNSLRRSMDALLYRTGDSLRFAVKLSMNNLILTAFDFIYKTVASKHF